MYRNGGEAPRAYIVNPQKNLTAEDVVKYIDSKVARHKRLLGGVKFVDAVMKNPVSSFNPTLIILFADRGT